MIIGIFGNMSSGKTVLAVKLAYDEFIKKKAKIISNIELKFPYKFIDSDSLITTVIQQPNIFYESNFLLDEAHNYLESRRSSSSVNLRFVMFLTQLGKLSCSLIMTSQMIRQIDIRFRELMDVVIVCNRIDEKGNIILENDRILKKKILIQCKGEIYLHGGATILPFCFVFDPEPYFKLYNTREIVIIDREKYVVKR